MNFNSLTDNIVRIKTQIMKGYFEEIRI